MQELTITVSDDVAAVIERKIAAGDFPNAGALVDQSIRESLVLGDEFERWLDDEIMTGIAADDADPSGAVPIEDVMSRLQQLDAGDRPDPR